MSSLRTGLFAFLLAVTVAFTAMAATAKDRTYDEKIKAHPFYEAMIETAKEKKGRELLEFFDAALQNDASTLPVIAYWLRDNSINVTDPNQLNSLYFMSYSDALLAMAEGYKSGGEPGEYRNLYKTAMFNLHIFELMASIDAMRCQDPTAILAVKKMIEARLDAERTGYKLFPRDVLDQLEKNALKEEDKYLTRPPNTDICSLGQARIIDLSKTPGVQQKVVPDPRYTGGSRTVYIPPPNYVFQPAIVPDGEWLKLRLEALKKVTKDWAERYASASR